ncbi:mCG1047180 [Mus musculus]|nr:mCG1047180 [Mus musculus]
MGTREMAMWTKVLVTKPDRLGLVPRTYTAEGENLSPQVVLRPSSSLECFELCRTVESSLPLPGKDSCSLRLQSFPSNLTCRLLKTTKLLLDLQDSQASLIVFF